jgi:CDP-paratose synthetase
MSLIFKINMRRQKQIKTILISGATGFLGSNILKRLVDQNHKVVILKRSFSNTERIDDYLKKIKSYDIDKVKLDKCFLENNIDAFIHCATDYGRKKIDPMQIIDSNLIFPLKLMEIAINNNCEIFLNTDTILDKGLIATLCLNLNSLIGSKYTQKKPFVSI